MLQRGRMGTISAIPPTPTNGLPAQADPEVLRWLVYLQLLVISKIVKIEVVKASGLVAQQSLGLEEAPDIQTPVNQWKTTYHELKQLLGEIPFYSNVHASFINRRYPRV